MAGEIRIVIADDQGVIRDAMSERLQRELDITVVGRAKTANEAITVARECKPDVILLDIDMPGMLAFEAARQLSDMLPNTRIIFLSGFIYDSFIDQALKAKAHGYVFKKDTMDVVIQAIREVASGGAYFSDAVRARIVVDSTGVRLRESSTSRLTLLSRREIEMLSYVAQGFGKKEIAAMTNLAVKTVDHHVTRLMNKLDIHDRVELTKFAISEGLINVSFTNLNTSKDEQKPNQPGPS